MRPSELKRLTVAIGSLLAKRYHSTVGVKAAGRLDLGDGRSGSLVDFAGQMEYLVSHQLLLASMHTLCVVIQPAPSFAKPTHRHLPKLPSVRHRLHRFPGTGTAATFLVPWTSGSNSKISSSGSRTS